MVPFDRLFQTSNDYFGIAYQWLIHSSEHKRLLHPLPLGTAMYTKRMFGQLKLNL